MPYILKESNILMFFKLISLKSKFSFVLNLFSMCWLEKQTLKTKMFIIYELEILTRIHIKLSLIYPIKLKTKTLLF